MMVTPVAKVPSALRKSRGSSAELPLESSLAVSGSGTCVGLSFIVSQRQVFGRQAKHDPPVIGARRIEVEGDVGVDRVRIAELPLQGAGHIKAARAACRKQERDGLGAEIDGKGAVAAHFGLGRDIRTMSAPRIHQRLDTGRTHDQPRRVDLGGSLRDLDLRRLEVAQFGAVIGGGAMPREIDIVVETGLRISKGYAR